MSAPSFFWPRAEPVPSLARNQVHVWAWELDRPPQPADWETLNPEESARARRFVFSKDRDRYVRAHCGLRRLLSAYTGMAAAQLAFSNNAYGKPQIQADRNPQTIRFNLSHSDGLAALAVSREYELGIDIERIRPIDAEVAKHHFSPSEQLALRNLPADQWLNGFYRCWTSKEALLKGEGLGLNLTLNAFDVEADPARAPALLGVRPPARFAPGWALVSLLPAPEVVGTLAVRDETGTFSQREPESARLQCFLFKE